MAKLIKTHVKTRSEGLFSYLKNVFRVCFESPFTRMISSLKYKCPPHEYSLFSYYFFYLQGVFQLTTSHGKELLMQASNDAERDEWAVAIGEAIRSLDCVSIDANGVSGSDVKHE